MPKFTISGAESANSSERFMPEFSISNGTGYRSFERYRPPRASSMIQATNHARLWSRGLDQNRAPKTTYETLATLKFGSCAGGGAPDGYRGRQAGGFFPGFYARRGRP